MEKETYIKVSDCIDYLHKIIDMTRKNELIWENINTLAENYDLCRLFKESSNGITKYRTQYDEVKIVFSATDNKVDEKFNLEYFPNDDLSFYRMPNLKDTQIVKRLEELEQFIERQINKRDTEKIAKIMGIE